MANGTRDTTVAEADRRAAVAALAAEKAAASRTQRLKDETWFQYLHRIAIRGKRHPWAVIRDIDDPPETFFKDEVEAEDAAPDASAAPPSGGTHLAEEDGDPLSELQRYLRL